jgi:cell division protein ZipA
MDELRLSLLALFVALIAGIYLRETLRKRSAARPQASTPDESVAAAVSVEVAAAEQLAIEAPQVSHVESFEPEVCGPQAPYAPELVSGEFGPEVFHLRDSDPIDSDITVGEPAFLDPSPVSELAMTTFPETVASPDHLEDWPADGIEENDAHDAHDVEAFSADGCDVPLGDIQLLQAEPALSADLGLDSVPEEGGLEGTLREAEDEPFQQGQLDLDGRAQRHEPTLSAMAIKAPRAEELIVVLHVMRSDRADMPAASVRAALGTGQIELGEMSIYHHYGLTYGGAHQPVFSVARAVEPGTFDADDESTYGAPGLTLFMRLPGPQDGAVVLELMFNTAQTLARDLDARVLDERRIPMSAQALNHLRDRVAEFSRRQKLVVS